MERALELAGILLARACGAYGLSLLVLSYSYAGVLLLWAAIWTAVSHAHGRRPWPWLPFRVRRGLRVAAEIAFGLINPAIYLLVLDPALPGLQANAGALRPTLRAGAWLLLAAFWLLRITGASLDARSHAARAGVRTLLTAALVWLALFTLKDAWLAAAATKPATVDSLTLVLGVLRLCPLYLIPAVLLWDYIRAVSAPPGPGDGYRGLFLLPGRAARVAFLGAVALAVLTAAATAQRRSDAAVRQLVASHGESIRAAAARYDVDARLVASIVYVTHRDQLSPFRDALERIAVSAWAMNLRGDFGIGSPDRVDIVGTDENPLLHRALDISIGLAQIKPRTAQTASVLASGVTPDELARPAAYAYRDVEPAGERWKRPPGSRVPMASPIPVPASRRAVAAALLDDRSNLAMCALILALYRQQWESANPSWSIRARPDILATLYQIGFARSTPHAEPRSNVFGTRVRDVCEQPWLDGLLRTGSPPG